MVFPTFIDSINGYVMPIGDAKQPFTLSRLNARVREVIEGSFTETYWLRAETSDVHINQASGHCYLEFI